MRESFNTKLAIMPDLIPCVTLVLALFAVGTHCGSYFITAPKVLQPGSDYDVTVGILNTTGVNVEISLQRWVWNGRTREYDVNILDSITGTYSQGQPRSVSIPVPHTTRCRGCRLKVRGRGSLQFEHTVAVRSSDTVVVIFIQTDKAIYKPGQLVRYRAFAVYSDLTMYTGDLNLEIRDPNNNKIQVLKGLNGGEYGVVEGSLKLSDQPQLGDWSISVTAEETTDSHTQSFTVADYDLPRFEVSVELPPFGLVSEGFLAGKVKARYTFGEDVKGRVELHVGPDSQPDQCGQGPKTTQITFDLDGSGLFQIPKDDIQRAIRLYDATRVKVTAFVTEATTGVVLNGSSVITYYNKDSKVRFLDNTPGVFKPGLPYTAYVQATTPDGKSPPSGSNLTLSVYTSVKYELTVTDQQLYEEHRFEGTYPLPGQNISLPADGLVPVLLNIPRNASSVTIKATFRGVSVTKSVKKMWSKSNNFLRLTLLGKNVKTGSSVRILVEGTEPLDVVNYQVIVRGREVTTGRMSNDNQTTSLNLDLAVTPEMAPVAHVVVYYNRGADEIVADGISFNVDGLFHNEVSVSLSRNESEPADFVEVMLSADPSSKVHVLAVDQSVLLLKSGNDVTTEKVNKEVMKFDRAEEKPTSSEFALSYSSTDAQEVFEQIGRVVITDVNMEKPYDDIDEIQWNHVSYDFQPAAASPVHGRRGRVNMRAKVSINKESSVQEVKRIRQIFPEAWLWADTQTGSNGTASLRTLVPDTITSWVVSAFATHPRTGLGIAPTTTKLKVFRPFFVSLSYASTVTRGEHVIIQATVFNYLESDAAVIVKLTGHEKFKHISIDASGAPVLSTGDKQQTISVPSDEQRVVYFPIVASDIGVVEIEIVAQSSLAADGVRRFINVQPEGVPVSFNKPVFFKVDNSTATETLDFDLPPSTVDGSASAKVKVTGSLLGFVDKLLDLPTGCGEQSMINFAPQLYILSYLQTTNQLTVAEESRLVQELEAGYQRQLTYQRYDGGFSPFGNSDPSGSSWLTAQVAGSFSEADRFIYVDPKIISRAIDWLVDRQYPNGLFANFGRDIDPNTQAARTAEGITAYIAIAIRKSMNAAQNTEKANLWSNSTARAIEALERYVNDSAIRKENSLTLAMVSYALTYLGSPVYRSALDKLYALNNTEGALVYWEGSQPMPRLINPTLQWRAPAERAPASNIMATSYAILAMTRAGELERALPSVQWLLSQRNADGGFTSTQDTSIALEVISNYATVQYDPETDLQISVDSSIGSDRVSEAFSITRENAWTLQIKELTNLPTSVTVEATGTGLALVDMVYSLHVNTELSLPSFDVSTVLLDDNIDSFNLMVCTKWLWDRETGMVVQEISIPSGFEPDTSTLGSVAGLERSERRGNTVAIYFDKISKSSLCYSMVMTRTGKVANSQRSYVRTFDYYQPNQQSTVFYHPRSLKESTICDVCSACCR